MSNETDSQRTDRIRDAQMRDRAPVSSRNPRSNAKKSYTKNSRSTLKKNVVYGQSDKSLLSGLLDIPLGGVRDVVIGIAYGLIPTILAVIFLPGAFKLAGILVLGFAATAGYMLGKATD